MSEGIAGCITEIYANTLPETDNGIRSAAVNISVEHISELLSRTTFVALIANGGDFVVELQRALAKQRQDCPSHKDDRRFTSSHGTLFR